MTDHRGYDTPERAARGGIPEEYCSVIASETRGDHAYVLLDTGSPTHPYPYGVHCVRREGRWLESSGSNSSGWEPTPEGSDLGCLGLWGEAPEGADAVRIRFSGSDHQAPVARGYYFIVFWDVPMEGWPQILGARVDGEWRLRSQRELRRERHMLDRLERKRVVRRNLFRSGRRGLIGQRLSRGQLRSENDD